MSKEENVVSLSDSLRSLKHLFTKLRDVKTNCVEFKAAASRVMTLIWQDLINFPHMHILLKAVHVCNLNNVFYIYTTLFNTL